MLISVFIEMFIYEYRYKCLGYPSISLIRDNFIFLLKIPVVILLTMDRISINNTNTCFIMVIIFILTYFTITSSVITYMISFDILHPLFIIQKFGVI